MRFLYFFLAIFLSFNFMSGTEGEENRQYELQNEPIDVIIPVTDKDLLTLELCIKGIKNNGKNVRRVIVVSDKKFTDKAEWFDEKLFPFSKKDVALHLCQYNETLAKNYAASPNSRVGWYYQQLLKFYSPFVIPEISSNVLVIDSDTIFLNPVTFLNDSHGALLNVGKEYWKPYFAHADRLTNGYVKRLFPKLSGITHHMLFQRAILEDLFDLVENIHGIEFWKAFCLCVDIKQRSGASEYEIYFNFSLSKTDQVKIRKLNWGNIDNLEKLTHYKKLGNHYVSCHSWLRAKT